MTLYPKQLHSVAELEKEKARLTLQCGQMEQDTLKDVENFKIPSLIFKREAKSKEASNRLSSLLGDFIPGAAPVLKLIEEFLPGSGSIISDHIKARATKLVTGATKEIMGGYLKWKAIELSFNGVSYLLRNRKKKKTDEGIGR